MKYIIAIIFSFATISIYAQTVPVSGINRVRINENDKTILADITPVDPPSINTNLNYYWYNANEIHYTQGGYSGKLLNGNYTAYFLNRNLEEQGVFDTGLKEGQWKTWAENGLLISAYTWHKGTLAGSFFVYNDLGKIIQSGFYRNNKLDGELKIYTSPDSVTTHYYKNGHELAKKPDSFLKKANPFKKIHIFKKQPKS